MAFLKVKDFDFIHNVTNSVYNTLQFSTLKDPASMENMKKRTKTVCLIDVEDACHDNDLYITNIVFQYYKKRRYTMQSTCGRNWNQIDCILLRDWLRCIIEEKAYSGMDCSSDHDLAGYIDLWGTIKIRRHVARSWGL